MTDSPHSGGRPPDSPPPSTARWERESQEDLRPPEQQPQPTIPEDLRQEPQQTAPEDLRPPEQEPQQTTELEIRFDVDEDEFDLDEDDGRWPARESRLAAARESLSAKRESVADSLVVTRGSLSATASKVGRWLHSLDRRPEFDVGRDPVAELTSGDGDGGGDSGRGERRGAGPVATARAEDEAPARDAPTRDEREADDGGVEIGVRFPTAPLGYNRQAVDSHITMLEEEIAELRENAAPPLSIEEEIERLGEETASILVVAHDKAHETARRAQQQAARAVSEAAADAERITAAAEQRLRELDEETDAVWRERERLLEDVREVSRTLATLADAASERFPAAPEPAAPGPSASTATATAGVPDAH